MRPSRLIKPLIRWVPYDDGRPGLHPTWPYEIWARVVTAEHRIGATVGWRVRWQVVAPVRRRLGLPSRCYSSSAGWSDLPC